jgi:hypothetical protein
MRMTDDQRYLEKYMCGIRVAEGAQFLSLTLPTWRSRVDLNMLDMRNNYTCVIAQVYIRDFHECEGKCSPFHYGMQRLFKLQIPYEDIIASEYIDRLSYEYGFDSPDSSYLLRKEQMNYLQSFWKLHILMESVDIMAIGSTL